MTTSQLNDSEWVRSALTRYEGPLLRYATRFTADPDLARDVVQDTFLRLCTADRCKVDAHLAGWLFTVCRNRALDVRKKEGRMDALNPDAAERYRSTDPSPSVVAARHEACGMVLDVLGTLPANQQEAFRLKFQDELTYREISQVMGVSLGKVSQLITAALETVRARLRAGIDLAQEV